MSADSDRRERLRQQTAAAATAARERQQERELRGPRPADLYVLEDSAGSLLEWAVLATPAGNVPQVELIPADSLALIGTGDVVSSGGDRSPLALRCRYPVLLPAAALEPRRRSGTISEGTLEKARNKKTRIEMGESVGSALERQVDAEPEYQSWCEDVLEPARESLLSSRGAAAPPSPNSPTPSSGENDGGPQPFRSGERKKRGRWRLEAPLALAATALLATSLALTIELRDLRSDHQVLQETVRHNDESHRRKLEAERLRRARDLETRDADIARLEALEAQRAEEIEVLEERIRQPAAPPPVRSLINLPFAVLSPQTLRSPGDLVSVTLAERVLLILQVDSTESFERYRLEILDPDGEEIWSRSQLVLASRSSELTVVLPGDLFHPGKYALVLSGLRNGTETELPGYRLEVLDAAAATEPARPTG